MLKVCFDVSEEVTASIFRVTVWYSTWAVKRWIYSLPKASEIIILRRCESHPERPLSA